MASPLDISVCYECSSPLPEHPYTCEKYTNPDITLNFCSEYCVATYEENGYMEAEEDYYCGEREVDSDPCDYER
jgi:hypothetical protein